MLSYNFLSFYKFEIYYIKTYKLTIKYYITHNIHDAIIDFYNK